MGSSSIRRTILEGLTGPVGPRGPTGPRGATGETTGFTGDTGPIGYYITSIDYDSNGNPILNLNNPNTPPIKITGLTGATGYTENLGGITLGSNYFLLQSFTGGTLNIYGLSFAGLFSTNIIDGAIIVNVADQIYDITVKTGATSDRLAYATSNAEISSTRLKIENLSDIVFSESEGISASSTFLDSSFNVAIIPPIPQENFNFAKTNYQTLSPFIIGVDDKRGIYLNLTRSSVFVINTPIGIAGFSLGTELFQDDDTVSLTMFVNGSEIWSFPSNVYFENKPDSTYFGCGMNIMHISTNDRGKSWIAIVTDKGYGVTGCNDFDSLGSCCYTDPDGNFECDDYVTKGFCDRVNGLFRSTTTCADACGTTFSTFCCSEGRCLSDIGEDECEYFGGKYYAIPRPNLSCSSFPASGDNTQRLCYDKCQNPVVCCKNGVCLGEMTSIVCREVYGGRGVTGTCETVDCCKEIPFYGACCKILDNGTSTCREDYIYNCKPQLNESFMGNNSRCVNETTCCSAGQTYEGICCIFNGGCIGTDRASCDLLSGEFHEGEFSCEICEETNCWERGTCPPPPGCPNPPCVPPPPPPCQPNDPECTVPAHRCVYERRGFYSVPVGCIEYRVLSGGNGSCEDQCECEPQGGNPGCWVFPPRTGGTTPRPTVVTPIGGGGGGGGGRPPRDDDEDGGDGRGPILGSPSGGATNPPTTSTSCDLNTIMGPRGWTLPIDDPEYKEPLCQALPYGSPDGGFDPDVLGCKCPSYPINGWMFNAGCTKSGPNGGCVCKRGGRDPAVLALYPGLPDDFGHGATSDQYPSGICEDKFGWEEIRQGRTPGKGPPPDEIACCCSAPPPDPGAPLIQECRNCCAYACHCKPFFEERNPCEDYKCCVDCECGVPPADPGNGYKPSGSVRFDPIVLPDPGGDTSKDLIIGCEEKCRCNQCQDPCFVRTEVGQNPCETILQPCLVCGGILTPEDTPCSAGAEGIPIYPIDDPTEPLPATFNPTEFRKLKDPISGIENSYYCDGPFNPCDDPSYINVGALP